MGSSPDASRVSRPCNRSASAFQARGRGRDVIRKRDTGFGRWPTNGMHPDAEESFQATPRSVTTDAAAAGRVPASARPRSSGSCDHPWARAVHASAPRLAPARQRQAHGLEIRSPRQVGGDRALLRHAPGCPLIRLSWPAHPACGSPGAPRTSVHGNPGARRRRPRGGRAVQTDLLTALSCLSPGWRGPRVMAGWASTPPSGSAGSGRHLAGDTDAQCPGDRHLCPLSPDGPPRRAGGGEGSEAPPDGSAATAWQAAGFGPRPAAARSAGALGPAARSWQVDAQAPRCPGRHPHGPTRHPTVHQPPTRHCPQASARGRRRVRPVRFGKTPPPRRPAFRRRPLHAAPSLPPSWCHAPPAHRAELRPRMAHRGAGTFAAQRRGARLEWLRPPVSPALPTRRNPGGLVGGGSGLVPASACCTDHRPGHGDGSRGGCLDDASPARQRRAADSVRFAWKGHVPRR